MKSKQGNKKGKAAPAESSNLAPPGTPENQKSTSTPSASPAGSTSSISSHLSVSAVATAYAMSMLAKQEAAAAAAASGVAVSGGAGPAPKSSNARSKGGAASKDKDGDKATTVAAPSSSYPLLTAFNLADFPKINTCMFHGTKGGSASGGAEGEAAASAAGNVTAAASANGAGANGNDLNKSIENLSMEDVDMLQAELETLWSSVAVRMRTLHRESAGLQSNTSSHHALGLEHFDPQHQEKIAAVATIIDHGTRTSVSAAAKLVMGAQLGGSGGSPAPSPSPSTSSVSAPTPKKASSAKGERQPKKKVKGEGKSDGKASKKGSDKPAARATQNRSHSVSSDIGSDGVFKHHEIPNQFWDSMESYFRDITIEDLNNLEKLIEEHKNNMAPEMEIPPLGKHWKDNEETAKKKAKETQANAGKDQVGPLTQRLVSALVNERVTMYQNDNQLNSPKEDASTGASSANSTPEGGFIHRQGLARALGLDGSSAAAGPSGQAGNVVEARIRDCLLENGLLSTEDANDPLMSNPNDEILAEIKRVQAAHVKLHNYNAEVFQRFLTIGKEELERQKLRHEVDKADQEVIDTYKVTTQLRAKKKPVPKKDKDAVLKALENRKKALQKLEAFDARASSLRYGGPPVVAPPYVAAGAGPSDPTGALRVQV